MSQDLKLGGDKDLTLTTVDSDVSSDFTLLAENTGTWCADDNAICDDQNLMFKTGTPNGYFYNWYTATAGSGIYETSSGNASYSICSKGWNLPTKDHYVALDRVYGGNGSNRTDANQINKFIAIPLNFNYTGYRAGNVIGNNPASASIAEGTYWSNTANSKALAHHLTFYSSINSFNPQHTAHKWYGFAIRCLAAN